MRQMSSPHAHRCRTEHRLIILKKFHRWFRLLGLGIIHARYPATPEQHHYRNNITSNLSHAGILDSDIHRDKSAMRDCTSATLG